MKQEITPAENISPGNYAEQPVKPEEPLVADTPKKAARRINLPPPERMVTRGVSGAIRLKSVGEILSGLDVSSSVFFYEECTYES